MEDEKIRSEFEAFVESNGLARTCSGTTDEERGLVAFWFVWKASRAAIVIELPEQYESYASAMSAEDGNGDIVMDADEVIAAVKAQGLRVKV